MQKGWLKQFTASLAILATKAVTPTLAFANDPMENAVNDDVITKRENDYEHRNNVEKVE